MRSKIEETSNKKFHINYRCIKKYEIFRPHIINRECQENAAILLFFNPAQIFLNPTVKFLALSVYPFLFFFFFYCVLFKMTTWLFDKRSLQQNL